MRVKTNKKEMNNDFDLILSLSTNSCSYSDEQPPSPPPSPLQTPPPRPLSPALPSANNISVQDFFTLLPPPQQLFKLSLPNPVEYSHDPPLSEVHDLPYPILPISNPNTNNDLPDRGSSRPNKRARRTSKTIGKSKTIAAPFPWATTRRATVYPLSCLLVAFKFRIISGDIQCKGCERKYEIEYNLEEKFRQVGRYIEENKNTMHDRAPSVWMNPVLPTCKYCHQENSLKPVMPPKKRNTNWLFLWLGQMLGCCTLELLRYFCKHTKKHRTGAKDRLLYSTYLCLGKQLAPDAPF